MKPLSGSGARGMMIDAMNTYGADSFAGRLACLFQGATDTTFYILAVYFGSVGIKKTRHAVTCGLLADLAGIVAAMVLFGSVASLSTVWNLADLFMGLMTICNLIAIVLLGKYAFRLLEDYRAQKRQGIIDPVFTKDKMPDIADDLECW
jgi:hypothetical protein